MFKRITAGIVAAGIAVTAFALPAQASSKPAPQLGRADVQRVQQMAAQADHGEP